MTPRRREHAARQFSIATLTAVSGSGRLQGEVALVTGSTAGIGRAIARRFGMEGARVVVSGRDPGRGAAAVADIEGLGGEAAFIAADLSGEDAGPKLVDAVRERFGTLTVLVNNAVGSAAGKDGPVEQLDIESWDSIFRVNVAAPMQLAAAAIPLMRDAGHGSIINISSRAAHRGSKGRAAYTASKGALNALTLSIAVDYAADGIRCNTISPGYVINSVRDADITPERRAYYQGMHLTRLGEADDIAYAAVYLASHESDFLTGSLLPLDGGGSAARGLTLG
ncbi:MAG: cpnA2 [Actinomycetia bacterium]|nr:cpnA2 [Actinomycetes bacterium]